MNNNNNNNNNNKIQMMNILNYNDYIKITNIFVS